MKGYKGQYTGDELRDIYYLFHEHNSDYEDIRNTRFPELMKYQDILYSVLFKVYLFKGNYPDFYFNSHTFMGHGYPRDIEIYSYNDGVWFVSYLLDILFHIKDEDLPLIDKQVMDLLEWNVEDNILYKLKSILLPKEMLEERPHLYTENMRLHFGQDATPGYHKNILYRNLNVYDTTMIEFRRKLNYTYDVKDVDFFYMILSYFYANSEKYNNDYHLLDNMLLNFYDKDEEYRKRYDDSYPYEGNYNRRYEDSVSIYNFICEIESELVKEITDSKKILTEDKKRDIERVSEQVMKGEITFPDACKYLEETYGFKNCMFYQNGISVFEYPNGDYLQYSYLEDDSCQYHRKKGR